MMEMQLIKAMDIFVRQYEDFPFPVVLADLTFQAQWSNRQAKAVLPALAGPGGLALLLNEYNPDQLLREISADGGCSIVDAVPLSGLNLQLLPIYAEKELAGVTALFYSAELRPDTRSMHRVSKTTEGLGTSVRQCANEVFSLMDTISIKADLLNSGWLKGCLNQIGLSVYRILRISDNISTYTGLQSGFMPVRARNMDLCEILRAGADTVTELGRRMDIDVRFKIPQTPCPANVDRALFELALFNLVHNSLYYTKEGNAVLIELSRSSTGISLRVEDQGLGIPEDKQDELWKPYATYSHGGLGSGLGLGLALVRAVSSAHGARTELTSRVGEGTAVSLRDFSVSPTSPLSLGQTDDDGPMPDDRFSRLHIGLADATDSPFR